MDSPAPFFNARAQRAFADMAVLSDDAPPLSSGRLLYMLLHAALGDQTAVYYASWGVTKDRPHAPASPLTITLDESQESANRAPVMHVDAHGSLRVRQGTFMDDAARLWLNDCLSLVAPGFFLHPPRVDHQEDHRGMVRATVRLVIGLPPATDTTYRYDEAGEDLISAWDVGQPDAPSHEGRRAP